MFQRLAGVLGVLNQLPALGVGAKDLLAIAQQVFGVLTNLPDSQDVRGWYKAAINVLEVVAPRTGTHLDDGGLLLLRALERDDAWIDFVTQQMDRADEQTVLEGGGVPEGALAIEQVETPSLLPETAQAFRVGDSLQTIQTLLPLILSLVAAIRDLLRQGEPQQEGP